MKKKRQNVFGFTDESKSIDGRFVSISPSLRLTEYKDDLNE